MGIAVFVFIVVIVMALLLRAVELLALPMSPPYLKRPLQAPVVVVAALDPGLRHRLLRGVVTGCPPCRA